MKHLEYWLWGQVALEAVLVIVVGYYLLRLRQLARRWGPLPGEVAAAVDQRLQAMEARIRRLEERKTGPPEWQEDQGRSREEPGGEHRSPPPGSGVSLRAKVEELSRQGLPPEEIARRLGLRPAEVKVALELARLRPA